MYDGPVAAPGLHALVLEVRSVAVARPRSAAPTEQPSDFPGPYRQGEWVQIEWHGGWYPGTILEVDGARYKVTYDGYSSAWDEWVEPSRLRRP